MIAKFMGPKPNSKGLEMWVGILKQELEITSLSFCGNVDGGYF